VKRLSSIIAHMNADLGVVVLQLGFMLLALIWKFDFSPFMVLIIAILNDGVCIRAPTSLSHLAMCKRYKIFHIPLFRVWDCDKSFGVHREFLVPFFGGFTGTIMTIAKDRVKPSPLPDSWKLKEIFATGIVLGCYLALCTVIFFWLIHETDFFPVQSIPAVGCYIPTKNKLNTMLRKLDVSEKFSGTCVPLFYAIPPQVIGIGSFLFLVPFYWYEYAYESYLFE
jgi:hypothetical protein